MSWSCSMHVYKILVGKPEWKKPSGRRPSRRGEDYV
jgi:hypothetical protein